MEPDKKLHAIAGAAAGTFGTLVAVFAFHVHLGPGFLCGLGTAIVAGVGKEVWDRFHPPHVPDSQDALVTIGAGGAAALLTAIALRIVPVVLYALFSNH